MKDEYRGAGGWSTLGLEIVLCVLFGFFGGRWLDGRFGTDPWISVLGFFFGCAAAGKAIHRSLKEMQAVTEREERRKGNPPPRYDPPAEKQGSNRAGPLSGERSSPMDAGEDHDDRTS